MSGPDRDLRGRPLDSKGRSLDRHDRPLDMFDRPLHSRIEDPIEELPLPGFPNVVIGFPSFMDWVSMYDPRRNRGFQRDRASYAIFKTRHEKTMLAALGEIAGRESGKALLRETNGGFTIQILPIDFLPSLKMWVKYHKNAVQLDDVPASAMSLGMYAGTRKNKTNRVGAGSGSDAQVFFSPERLRSQGPGMNPDEILFHEMVHAIRATQGVSTTGFKMSNDYDNQEEFTAVVVTNIYLSEKKQTALRANHGSDVLKNSDKFLDSPEVPAPGARGLIGNLRLRMPQFFGALASIGPGMAKFNPLRQLAEETKRASQAHENKMRAFDRASSP